VAQTIYLDKHFGEIIASKSCDVDLPCKDDFGSACLVGQFDKDQSTQYEFLYSAIAAESKKRSDREILQEKCLVKRFMEGFQTKARLVNPIEITGLGEGCIPNSSLKNHHATYLNDFLSVLFAGQDAS